MGPGEVAVPLAFAPASFYSVGMTTLATQEERGELREQIKSVRAEWRERLSLAAKLSPNSKLAKRASVLLMDVGALEDRIEESGGEDNLVFLVCSQVASGVSLSKWCQHYGIERGLMWAFMTETEERFERYQRALRGIADQYVEEVVGIADDVSDKDDVPAAKLQAEMRLRVAGVHDKKRFGRDSDTSPVGTLNTLPAAIQITFVQAVDGRVIEGSACQE